MKFIVENVRGCILVVLFLIVTVSETKSHGNGRKWNNYRSRKHGGAAAMFIFGDSFLDAGNNNYINTTALDQSNFWPYGESYFNFPTGRFSDGRLISDFIAEYANLPMIPPFLQPGNTNYYSGANFASGGAGALVQTFQGSVIPLKTQARNFKEVATRLRQKLGSSEAKILLSEAVYLFSIGTNDYLSPFFTDSVDLIDHSHYVAMIIGNLTSIVKEIYKRGARKFGLMNVPPLGCLPGTRKLQSKGNGGCFEELSSLAGLHNQALYEILIQLEKELNGFKYVLYDFNADVTRMMINPTKYGLKEGVSACCGSGAHRGEYSCGGKRGEKQFQLCYKPNEYLFWDSYHLTQSAYKQLTTRMWGYTVKWPKSTSLRDLFQLY